MSQKKGKTSRGNGEGNIREKKTEGGKRELQSGETITEVKR